MPPPDDEKLVVAISSRALFDLEASNRVFEEQGIDAYYRYQLEHEDEVLAPGIALAQRLTDEGHECLLIVSSKAVDARMTAHYPRLRFVPGRGRGFGPGFLDRLRFFPALLGAVWSARAAFKVFVDRATSATARSKSACAISTCRVGVSPFTISPFCRSRFCRASNNAASAWSSGISSSV